MSRVDTLLSFISQNPNDPFPRYALAIEYKSTGRLDEAWAIFQALIAENPEYVAAYLHAGNTLVGLGRTEEARTIYSRGIEACSGKGDAHIRSQLESALTAMSRP